MAEDRFILTQTGYDRLQQELEALQQMRARETEVIDDVDEDTGNLEGEEEAHFLRRKRHLSI
jgi:hypothetical protein